MFGFKTVLKVLSIFNRTQNTPKKLRKRYQMNFRGESKQKNKLCDIAPIKFLGDNKTPTFTIRESVS